MAWTTPPPPCCLLQQHLIATHPHDNRQQVTITRMGGWAPPTSPPSLQASSTVTAASRLGSAARAASQQRKVVLLVKHGWSKTTTPSPPQATTTHKQPAASKGWPQHRRQAAHLVLVNCHSATGHTSATTNLVQARSPQPHLFLPCPRRLHSLCKGRAARGVVWGEWVCCVVRMPPLLWQSASGGRQVLHGHTAAGHTTAAAWSCCSARRQECMGGALQQGDMPPCVAGDLYHGARYCRWCEEIRSRSCLSR
jgi:hypothetical protein